MLRTLVPCVFPDQGAVCGCLLCKWVTGNQDFPTKVKLQLLLVVLHLCRDSRKCNIFISHKKQVLTECQCNRQILLVVLIVFKRYI